MLKINASGDSEIHNIDRLQLALVSNHWIPMLSHFANAGGHPKTGDEEPQAGGNAGAFATTSQGQSGFAVCGA